MAYNDVDCPLGCTVPKSSREKEREEQRERVREKAKLQNKVFVRYSYQPIFSLCSIHSYVKLVTIPCLFFFLFNIEQVTV